MSEKEILTIRIILDGSESLNGGSQKIVMIHFHGDCQSELFHGTLIPGGIDTQRIRPDGQTMLSARYMMEGTDCDQQNCRIFIENNGAVGTDGRIRTKPKIVTDSKALQWLESAELTGTVTSAADKEILIHIFYTAEK